VRRLRGTDTNAAHDGAGQCKTTVAAVTIRHRHRSRRQRLPARVTT
jgi:hypothetical protein